MASCEQCDPVVMRFCRVGRNREVQKQLAVPPFKHRMTIEHESSPRLGWHDRYIAAREKTARMWELAREKSLELTRLEVDMLVQLKHLMLTTVEDPYSIKSWSGIPFSLREALERRVEKLTVFRPGPPSRNPVDVAHRLWNGGRPPKYPLWMTKASLEKNARQVKAEIARTNPDAVLSISSQCIAHLVNPGRPVFMFSDSPWVTWQEAYKGTVSETIRAAWYAEQEAKAARRIDGLCFGSSWAIDEADRKYQNGQLDASLRQRLHITPLGANWTPKLSREEVLARVDSRATDVIELLYLGKDWIRKGGPLAVEVAGLLRLAGHKVQLHIVGCRPNLPPEISDYVTVHGYFSQSDAVQSSTLAELFLRSHFLIVPTLAECFGIVFAEAQAFALPPISRAIHALPTVIADGESGLLMGPTAPASSYVERILKLRSNPGDYRQMAVNARDRFERLLNWDKTAEEIVQIISLRVAAQRFVKQT